jgi:phosphatidylinositol 4-kinase A
MLLQAKIDEEMAKIKLEVGVYLPSNPDGKVIDIDKNSGRPLQSHAKVCEFISSVSFTET